MTRDEAIVTARINAATHKEIYVVFRCDGSEWDVTLYETFNTTEFGGLIIESIRWVLPNGEVTRYS